jgi:hypothetical protein
MSVTNTLAYCTEGKSQTGKKFYRNCPRKAVLAAEKFILMVWQKICSKIAAKTNTQKTFDQ